MPNLSQAIWPCDVLCEFRTAIVVMSLAFAGSIIVGDSSAANVVYHGPLPYLGVANSPFAELVSNGQLRLEDFEDDLLNTGGVIANCGGPIGARPSVDEDDGAIDGDGFGVSLSTGGGIRCGDFLDLSFSPDFDDQYPNIIGFVVVANSGFSIAASIFDSDGTEISDGRLFELPDVTIGRNSIDHRFIGFEADVGIARLVTKGALRIDHLQYGIGIPEPSAGLLLLMGAGALICRRRRRCW